MKFYHKGRRPFWIIGNATFGLLCFVMGGVLAWHMKPPGKAYLYCEPKTCVRVMPGEDPQTAMLDEILALRHNGK